MTHRIVVRVANAQGVSESHPEDETRLALAKAGAYGVPDVVLLSEVSWCDVATIARELGWVAVQHGERGSADAGVAIASRLTPAAPLPPRIGSLATREGGGIRQRPIVGARIGGLSFWAAHAPPPRSPMARALYVARVRACRGVVGGDFNLSGSWMRRTSVRRYRCIGVLGLLVPIRWKARPAKPVDIGSDHPAVDVLVERRRVRP